MKNRFSRYHLRAFGRRTFELGLLALALVGSGCEGRHIDMSRRLPLVPDQKPEPSDEPERSSGATYDVVVRRLSDQGADPRANPALYSVWCAWQDRSGGFRTTSADFYVKNESDVHSVSDDRLMGRADCQSRETRGACQSYNFKFFQGRVHGEKDVAVHWSMGERYRLQALFDGDSQLLDFGEGRIEEAVATIENSELRKRSRWLAIARPLWPPQNAKVALSAPTLIFQGDRRIDGERVVFDWRGPLPSTDFAGYTISIYEQSRDLAPANFIVDLPNEGWIRLRYRRFSDVDNPEGAVVLKLSRVSKGVAP